MPASFGVLDKYNPDKNMVMVEFPWDAPLLEVELNEMQKIQNEARAAMFRSQMHSGVIDLPTPTFSTSTPNGFVIPKFKALINGYPITVQNYGGQTDGSNLVTLPAPDTTGSREDLVFLEAWFEEVDFSEAIKQYGNADGAVTITNDLKDGRIGAETTRRIQLKWRLRTVAGVDFSTYKFDGFTKIFDSVTNLDLNSIFPQGGNTSPLIGGNSDKFTPCSSISISSYNLGTFQDDRGLYVAGRGTSATKSTLATYDGYSYAIPLFRVKRRNSSGYTPSNPNGARSWTAFAISVTEIHGNDAPFKFTSTKTDIQVGDIILISDARYALRVLTSDGAGNYTAINTGNTTATIPLCTNQPGYWLKSDHPQSLYSNVIDQRDITDLRHRTQAQYNYDYELKRASDQFMRGEIGS
jgi:hypothetical protein